MYFLIDHLKRPKRPRQTRLPENFQVPAIVVTSFSPSIPVVSHPYDISAVTPVHSQRRISLDPSGFELADDVLGKRANNNNSNNKGNRNAINCCRCNNDAGSIYSNDIDEYYEETKRVSIPDPSSDGFSFRKLWAFTGPGVLMSVAYLDPGNIESDLQSGAAAKYQLLWVLLWSTLFGLVMQRLAARLGTVSGLHLAEACYRYYPPVPRFILWLLAEAAVIQAEMQEVIGSTIAFYLLSNKGISLSLGVCLSVAYSYGMLLMETFGLRKLEVLFGLMIAVMAASFGYEYVQVAPHQFEVFQGLLIPTCQSCDKTAFLQGVGIIGAVIMPHNLFLHSALVKSRDIDRSQPSQVKQANRYYLIETTFALGVSLLINIFIVSVFAHGIWDDTGLVRKSNADILQLCVNQGHSNATKLFPNDNSVFHPNMYTGGVFLGCQYGDLAVYVWAIGILASGQSSTMAGTYAGQFIMEGFLNLRLPRWKRALVTRILVLLPPFLVSRYLEIEGLSKMNDYLNASMSMLLPFAILPLISMTSRETLMGQFRNSKGIKMMSCVLAALLISVNMYFLSSFLADNVPKPMEWYAALAIILFGVIYVSLCTYLFFHVVIMSMEFSKWSVETIANLTIVIVVNLLILILAYLAAF